MDKMSAKIWVVFAVFLLLCAIPDAFAAAITYTYDNAGRLTRADYGGGKNIVYTYDNAGNLIQKIITGTSRNIVDFDGDGKTDIVIYRKSNGAWFITPSSGGASIGAGWGGDQSDRPVVGDWNGSGTAKIGVYRQSTGTWYLDLNGNRGWDGCAIDACIGWGGDASDRPVVGDWNGSGATKIGVYRQSNGTWYLDLNGNRVWDGCVTDGCIGWGGDQSDIPVVGDWNGSGTEKIGVYRGANGVWYLDLNGNRTWDGCGIDGCIGLGGDPSDEPVVGTP